MFGSDGILVGSGGVVVVTGLFGFFFLNWFAGYLLGFFFYYYFLFIYL